MSSSLRNLQHATTTTTNMDMQPAPLRIFKTRIPAPAATKRPPIARPRTFLTRAKPALTSLELRSDTKESVGVDALIDDIIKLNKEIFKSVLQLINKACPVPDGEHSENLVEAKGILTDLRFDATDVDSEQQLKNMALLSDLVNGLISFKLLPEGSKG